MRCLRVVTLRHLDGSTSSALVVPCGTPRTKRRTFKKWLRRSADWSRDHARR